MTSSSMAYAPEAQDQPQTAGDQAVEIQTRTADGRACRACGAANPADAHYCCECGEQLVATACPNCSQAVSPTGDFCEACGHWLKTGQCCFCSSSLPPDSDFCPECGLPQGGIACDSCGTVGRFDFCSCCGKALTEGAAQALALIAEDPEAQAALQQLAELEAAEAAMAALPPQDAAPPADTVGEAPAQGRRPLLTERNRQALARMSEFLTKLEKGEQQKIAARAASEKAEEEARQAEAEQRAEEERLKKTMAANHLKSSLELAKLRLMSDLKAMFAKLEKATFSDHQEARRIFMALKQRFPGALRGWRCNRYGNVHDSPNSCADPAAGGTWLLNSPTD